MKHGLYRAEVMSLTLLLFSTVSVSAEVVVIREWKRAVSPPLRDMVFKSGAVAVPDDPDGPDETPEGAVAVVKQADTAVQEKPGTQLKTSPGMNLLGLGSGFTGPQGAFQFPFAPPDPNAAVGATQIVEMVNLSFAVFDKTTGSPVLGPISIASLWDGFSTSCSSTAGLSIADPIVLYDKQAGRWVVNIHTLGIPYYSCFAVSTGSDATGTYNLYVFEVQAYGRLTAQKVGSWPDAYYISTWIFKNSSTYVGPEACAVDRNRMIAGQDATMQCFQIDNTHIYGMLPSDLDGSSAPPAGSPNYFLIQGPAGSNSLYLYRFHVDFTTPGNSTLTGPVTIAVAPYTSGSRDNQVAIPQLGTSQLLDVNGSDLMNRLAYRNFPQANPAHESLVVTHSVLAGTGANSRTGVRWYELRSPGTTPTVFQQGTYSPDTTDRWMGSIAMDKMGDMAIGYSVSSSSIYPAIRYTGRVSTDPINVMETEAVIFSGIGSQTDGGRWGDYTSMSVDPADDCTMWYAGEYMAATGPLNWATRLFSFKFSSCP